jgi:hypothetical protein
MGVAASVSLPTSSVCSSSVYDKDEAADLTAAEKRALKAAIEEESRQRARQRRLRRVEG